MKHASNPKSKPVHLDLLMRNLEGNLFRLQKAVVRTRHYDDDSQKATFLILLKLKLNHVPGISYN